jgi:hypothetical protein
VIYKLIAQHHNGNTLGSKVPLGNDLLDPNACDFHLFDSQNRVDFRSFESDLSAYITSSRYAHGHGEAFRRLKRSNPRHLHYFLAQPAGISLLFHSFKQVLAAALTSRLPLVYT